MDDKTLLETLRLINDPQEREIQTNYDNVNVEWRKTNQNKEMDGFSAFQRKPKGRLLIILKKGKD